MNAHNAYAAVASSSEELLETHAPLVKRIALHLAGRLPPNVELDDLIQAGALGLMEAAQRFDPSAGASFATFAGIRIRGAMIDELRRYDWSPRSTRRKLRAMDEAIRNIEAETGREATESEVAQALDMDDAEYRKLLLDSVSTHVGSLEQVAAERGDGAVLAHSPDDPAQCAEQASFADALGTVIADLPEREQLMLSLYYEQELNLKEIGAVLGVSESRVSQIHGQALARVRARLAA